MDRLIKTVLYLVGYTGLGYGLLKICSPSESDIKEMKSNMGGIENSPIEVVKKKQQFVDVLKLAASSETPLYRLDKEGIERALRK